MFRTRVGAAFTGLYYNLLSFFGEKKMETDVSIYSFTMNDLRGTPVSFEKYRGKYMLIVNTASKCAFTPQYDSLEKMHERLSDKVAVLGFPANNFLWQEPGSDNDIAEFCQVNFGVKFQMFSKTSVKGPDKAPLFKWLEKKTGKSPSWNFSKYLIGPSGKVLGYFSPNIDPLDNRIVGKII